MTERTTAELLDSCRAGDVTAWSTLVARHSRLVHAVARREGLSREDAADVTQDTFMALLERLDALDDPERLPWWLMTVARRRSWRFREHGRRSAPVSGDILIDLEDVIRADGVQPDDWVELSTVHEGLMRLGEPCGTLLRLLFLDPGEPTYAEISRRMDMPIGSIGPARASCLQRLSRLLDRLEPS